MYLSKVQLLPTVQAGAELAKLSQNGVYASHQLLWQLFPNQKEREFLYREEQDDFGQPQFFVLSKKQPTSTPLFAIESKAFTPQLMASSRLAFKLRVNPTICITPQEGKSQRHDVLMHAKRQNQHHAKNAEQLKSIMDQAAIHWLADEKRLAQWGVALDSLPHIMAYNRHHSNKRSGLKIQFSSVDFEGLLTVKDPEVFMQQYQKGFGRAKAMGCGLMLIRRIS
ncbi:type I-E CRISPR-associated protein Cas6/Cse3/CasE [Shewanella sp. NIFS-20-20]|uniref:type I-E CRISPR-associated protein Cas6/Cse3/CasE n=1 Tax=Shewanella sp. NIFS-20-20 TaxID=2853806 RepID=UPI001C4808C3|nr:type I-E CRISPR-associated protein Cas6/Cse3/CasE [Shewanella sp. NIFS-20-20]MBV7315802.1 type I-E CRISPR-associated protein Cas6/Cse3/CasE [Shewanella sp. NIFS-20-20]